jgi:hypothetical protein
MDAKLVGAVDQCESGLSPLNLFSRAVQDRFTFVWDNF